MPRNTVLVVDDEVELLGLLAKRLQVNGYDCLTATNGKDTLDIARRELPDLIILDILMPGMDGSEVAARLREDPKTKDIPILFLTCLFTKREEGLGGHEVGKNFFVAKPYDPDDLLREISSIIGKSSVD